MIERDADALGGTTKQASRAEIVRYARHHYEEITREAGDWMSTIGHALDAYEHEPELRAQLAEAQQELADLKSPDRLALGNSIIADLKAHADAAEQQRAALQVENAEAHAVIAGWHQKWDTILAEYHAAIHEPMYAGTRADWKARAITAEAERDALLGRLAQLEEALKAVDRSNAHHGDGSHCTCSQREREQIVADALRRDLQAPGDPLPLITRHGPATSRVVQSGGDSGQLLLGRLAQIEQEMQLREKEIRQQIRRGADAYGELARLAGVYEWMTDTIRDLRVRSTPRTEPT